MTKHQEKRQDVIQDSEVVYEPVKIQCINLEDRSEISKVFLTEPKTANINMRTHRKAYSNILVSENNKCASKPTLKLMQSPKKSSMLINQSLEKQKPKLLSESLVMNSCQTQDLSYRKRQIITEDQIPPKLLSDSPNFRPTNRNYAKFLKEMKEFEDKFGKRITQSHGLITYAKNTERPTHRPKADSLVMPRYLK